MGPNGRLAAIGVDGDRATSSVEIRPGVSPSGEELVNRIADLLQILRQHYKPRSVAYRAGAYVEPEPLGGHAHLGWDEKCELGHPKYPELLWRITQIVTGWQTQGDFLLPRLWLPAEVIQRENWARQHERDFAQRFNLRPRGLDEMMRDKHFEFRFLPSWLNSPEAAYAVLGGAEVIVREALAHSLHTAPQWESLVVSMYTQGYPNPPGGPSLTAALRVAEKYVAVKDFAENWG